MPIEILMPALSPTMTEGNLVAWLKAEGDTISPGEVIAEIETDKATMEVEAVDEGVLGKILVAAGTEGVSVNAAIAILLEEGEDKSSIKDNAYRSDQIVVKNTQNSEKKSEGQPDINEPKTGKVISENTKVPLGKMQSPLIANQDDVRVAASPLARRMAEHAGLDLAKISGSGPNGRIIKADIDQVLSQDNALKLPPVSTVTSPSIEPSAQYDAIPNNSMRKVIASRLTESKQAAPHFYMTVDCNVDALKQVRMELNEKVEGTKISINDLIIRASAIALKQVPEANASWTEEATLVYKTIDISVAVAIEGGLITPIIRDAGAKGVKEISVKMKDLANRAREGKLMPEEYQGGTFSISNLGMYGVKEFSAVINPPQGAILAIGAAEERPIIKDGAVAAATLMTCTLSVDHRVVDGAVGARFLSAFKRLIEDPLTMLL
ncbi:MAG: pyruvate dehydrogenase complex dihydrolipoamide acetyltransferase [Pseudomonadota bacterium]|nr:pyruvate dehydrogenase complex dihydrolipoamide acetyltransferase [Pseudomonadota bacterium]